MTKKINSKKNSYIIISIILIILCIITFLILKTDLVTMKSVMQIKKINILLKNPQLHKILKKITINLLAIIPITSSQNVQQSTQNTEKSPQNTEQPSENTYSNPPESNISTIRKSRLHLFHQNLHKRQC